ncbi:MAG: RHS repeat-associated core domain-containing protein [Gemmatimonadaceae bacterium]
MSISIHGRQRARHRKVRRHFVSWLVALAVVAPALLPRLTAAAVTIKPRPAKPRDSLTRAHRRLTPIVISVSTTGLNAETSVSRAQCLTIAAGDEAAVECGDLRVVHALPPTSTMNTLRAPVLLFNSRHAKPGALVAANVSLTSGAPTSLAVTLTISGYSPATRTYSWNSACASATCRIVLPVDASVLAIPTGAYDYTLTVQATDGTNTGQSSASGSLVVIDRSTSPFGAGWWLEGLEQILAVTNHADRKLWIGGDGSTRVFTRQGSSNYWLVTPTVDRPDTLEQLVDGRWHRHLWNGAFVEFDASGNHVRTVNAVGHVTSFAYNGSITGNPLQIVTLPVPSGSATSRQYSFSYNVDGSGHATGLASATAPAIGTTARTTTFGYTSTKWISSITDPDGHSQNYSYDAAHRLVARRNKLNDSTSFTYDEGEAIKQVRIDLSRTNGAGQAIVTALCVSETRSVASCASGPQPVSQVVTAIDGPRSDVADSSRFFVNRFGAPDTVVNAVGEITRVGRDDSRFPMLATSMVQPNGHQVYAYLNARALVDSVVDIDPLGSQCGTHACDAVTKYSWNVKWDRPDVVTLPQGEQTSYGIDATTGYVRWVQAGSDSSTRARYDYTTDGLLRTVREAGARTQDTTALQYDAALGNLKQARSPLGFVTTHWPDAIGRDTLVTRPIAASGQYLQKATARFNILGADTLSIISGPDLPNAPTNTVSLTVRKLYDAEGNLTSLSQWGSTDPNGIGTIQVQRTYDAFGRLTQETGGPDPAIWRYDAASNLTNGGRVGGDNVVNVYDATNRVKLHNSDSLTYSTSGMLVRAANGDAQVGRGYYPNGAVAVDTLRIRTAVGSNFSQHVYVTRYRYDLNGRRRWIIPPAALLPSPRVSDSIEYRYDAVFGQLAKIIDANGYNYRFEYDSAGRLRRDIRLSGRADSVVKDYAYDADGRATRIAGNTVSYDAASHMLTAGSESFSYDGLDHLVEAHTRGGSEYYTFDPLGNRAWSQTGLNPESHYVYRAGTGELLKELRFPLDPTAGDTTVHWVNHGLTTEKYTAKQLGSCPDDPGGANPCYVYGVHDQLYYFDEDRRLVTTALLSDSTGAGSGSVYRETGESRYDALGRRIFNRLVRGTNCQTKNASSGCRSTLTRTVWDGAQVLGEIRVPGDTGDAALESDAPYEWDYATGVIGYVNAPDVFGMDLPVALHRSGEVVVPIADARGAFYDARCPSVGGSCGASVPLPASGAFGTTSGDPDSLAFFGSALWAQRDPGTGLQYRRNRHYDPTTGRFIQADPIGLAGGLNAYGFANGDPVSYSDPFGLCPIEKPLCNWIKATLMAAGTDIGFLLGGGSGLLTGPGAVVASPVGAMAGATVGAGIGLAAGELTDRVFFSEKEGGGHSPGSSGGGDAAQQAKDWLANTNRSNPGLNRDLSKWFNDGGKLPGSISREYLQNYLTAARDAIARGIDKSGIQALRVEQIQQALANMEPQ